MAGAPSHWFERSAPPGARRMSGLAELMTAVAKVWGREFAALSSVPCEIAFKTSTSPTAETVLAAGDPAAILAQVRTTWGVPIVLRFDKRFVTATIEAMFGSAGDEDVIETEPGPLSPIEGGVADAIATQVAGALTAVVSESAPATFTFERLVPKLDPSVFGKPQTQVLVASFALKVLGVAVTLDALVPQAVLALMGEDMGDLLDGSRTTPDPLWSERLGAEVGRASVRVKATVDALALTLADLAALQPGQVLALPAGAGGRVRLSCADRDLFRCDLGQSNGLLTVRVSEPVTDA